MARFVTVHELFAWATIISLTVGNVVSCHMAAKYKEMAWTNDFGHVTTRRHIRPMSPRVYFNYIF